MCAQHVFEKNTNLRKAIEKEIKINKSWKIIALMISINRANICCKYSSLIRY